MILYEKASTLSCGVYFSSFSESMINPLRRTDLSRMVGTDFIYQRLQRPHYFSAVLK